MLSSQPRLTCASPGVSSSLREATRPLVLGSLRHSRSSVEEAGLHAVICRGSALSSHDRERHRCSRALAGRVRGGDDERVAPKRKLLVLREPSLEAQLVSARAERV